MSANPLLPPSDEATLKREPLPPAESVHQSTSRDKSVPWYQRPGVVVAALILLFPIGVILMWTGRAFPIAARWSITAFFAFVMVSAILSPASSPRTNGTTGGGVMISAENAQQSSRSASILEQRVAGKNVESLSPLQLARLIDRQFSRDVAGDSYWKIVTEAILKGEYETAAEWMRQRKMNQEPGQFGEAMKVLYAKVSGSAQAPPLSRGRMESMDVNELASHIRDFLMPGQEQEVQMTFNQYIYPEIISGDYSLAASMMTANKFMNRCQGNSQEAVVELFKKCGGRFKGE